MPMTNPVIDSDGHVFEIDESWETYADPAYGDRWPRLITDSSGRQIYFFEGRYSHTGREVGPPEGTSAARVREGASNPRMRVCKTWRSKGYTSPHSFQDFHCELAGG